MINYRNGMGEGNQPLFKIDEKVTVHWWGSSSPFEMIIKYIRVKQEPLTVEDGLVFSPRIVFEYGYNGTGYFPENRINVHKRNKK